MEELEDDPSSEMLAIELYRPAVYAARTFTYVPALRAQAVPLVHEHRRTGSPRAGIESGE